MTEPTGARAPRLLLGELERFARQLITDYSVSDALHDLVDASVTLLDLEGAGTLLARGGRLEFAAATPGAVTLLEELQERDQSGPCAEAFSTGETALVADLALERDQWPELVAVAERSGIRSVAATPLHLNGTRLGVLDLYDGRPRAWTDDDVRTAELLAALAAGYIANASRLDQARRTADQLQEALDSRVIIEQAKGVLAGERGIPVDQAFQVLRAHARSHNAPLREVANAVVNLGLRP
jgi:GAF domain-containing protein